MSTSQILATLAASVLIVTFQNCDGGGGVTDVVATDTGSQTPAPGPSPGSTPSPTPSPGTGASGPNPMPLGLKATFRAGLVLRPGLNNFPLDLNMTPAQTIEVDIGSNDTAYLTNSTMAIPNDDYVPFSGQTITFNAGEVSKNVSVNLLKFSGRYFSFTAANCKYGGVPFSCVYLF